MLVLFGASTSRVSEQTWQKQGQRRAAQHGESPEKECKGRQEPPGPARKPRHRESQERPKARTRAAPAWGFEPRTPKEAQKRHPFSETREVEAPNKTSKKVPYCSQLFLTSHTRIGPQMSPNGQKPRRVRARMRGCQRRFRTSLSTRTWKKGPNANPEKEDDCVAPEKRPRLFRGTRKER